MNDYTESYDYEFFIRLARGCDHDQFGAHYSYMRNLIHKELGKSSVSNLKHPKLLADVKKYMKSAAKHAITRKLEKGDKVLVKNYLEMIDLASNSNDLLVICKEGRLLFGKYRSTD